MGQRPTHRLQRLAGGGPQVGLQSERPGGQDEAQQVLRPLGVAAEPEQVAEHARHHRRGRGGGGGPFRGLPGHHHPGPDHRLGAHHPDVLGQPAVRRGDERPGPGAVLVGDAGQTAEHRGVGAAAAHDERAQHHVPRDQPVGHRGGGRGQRQHLLPDEAVRRRPDPGDQPLPLLDVQRRAEHAAAGVAADRPDDELVEVGQHVRQRGRVAAPPGVDRRQPQRLPEQPLAEPRQEGQQARVLEDPRAEGVHHAHRALPDALEQTRRAQPGAGPQLQRVGPGRVDAPQDDVDLFPLAQPAEPDAALPHRQVAALEQGEAEQGGDEGLVERGLGVRARAEHHDPRVLHRGRGRLDESRPHGLEERGQPVQVRRVVELRHHPGDDTAVLHGEPRAGRGLGAVRHDLPAAARVAAEVDGDQEQPLGGQRPGAHDGTQVLGVVEHDRGRQVARREQPARAVEVGQHGVQQLGPLHDPGLEPRPVPVVEHERHGVQAPGTGLGQLGRRRGRRGPSTTETLDAGLGV